MAILTVNIESKKDLSVLEEILNCFGLEYQVNENDDEALEASLGRALQQAAAGLGQPHAEVMADIRSRLKK